MAATWKNRLAIGMIMLIALGGCNPFNLLYFLGGGPDEKIPPEFPLKASDKKETKVLVLVSAPINMPEEFIGVDRTLSTELIRAMNLSAEANKQKLKIVPSSQVEKYKKEHQNWSARSPSEIGEFFEADFVINLEVQELRMYLPGSNRTFLQGWARVTGTAYDLTKGDKEKDKDKDREPRDLNEFTLKYPRDHEIEVEGSESISKFRQGFVKQIAVELSWKFTEHELRDKVSGTNGLNGN